MDTSQAFVGWIRQIYCNLVTSYAGPFVAQGGSLMLFVIGTLSSLDDVWAHSGCAYAFAAGITSCYRPGAESPTGLRTSHLATASREGTLGQDAELVIRPPGPEERSVGCAGRLPTIERVRVYYCIYCSVVSGALKPSRPQRRRSQLQLFHCSLARASRRLDWTGPTRLVVAGSSSPLCLTRSPSFVSSSPD